MTDEWSAFDVDPARTRMERDAPLAEVIPIRPTKPPTPERRFRVHPFDGDPEDPTTAAIAFDRAEDLAASGRQVAIERELDDGTWRPFTRRPVALVAEDLWPRGLARPVAWTTGKDPKPTHFAVEPDGYRVIQGLIPLPPLSRRPILEGAPHA